MCGGVFVSQEGQDISEGVLASHSKALEHPQSQRICKGPVVNLMLLDGVPAGSVVRFSILGRISTDGS